MTYRKSIITALCFLPFVTMAQERQAINKIGINYSVDGSSLDNGSKNVAIGFHSGFAYLHQFNNGLILEGGLQYARFGYASDGAVWIPPNTLADPALPIGNGRNYFDYLAIPLKVGYGWQLGKRISLSASSGISTNVFLARRTKTGRGSEKSTTSYFKEPYGAQYERINFVSVTSVGIDIRLCGAFSVRVEPTFRYFINPIMDSPAKERPYSAGLNTTVFYSLGNKSKHSAVIAP